MKVIAVCEGGGHLTELLYIFNQIRGYCRNTPLDIVLVTEQTLRTQNINKNPKMIKFSKIYYLKPSMHRVKILRYLQAVSIRNFVQIAKILKAEKPDVLISTAGWPSFPAFILAQFVFRIPTIYIHSWSRVFEKSDSGRVLYYISNQFIVQWPQLLKKYKSKAKYYGGVV